MDNKFKVGDRVVCECWGKRFEGEILREDRDDPSYYLVDLDQDEGYTWVYVRRITLLNDVSPHYFQD